MYTQLDKIMLKNSVGGTTSVGYYNLAQKIMTMVNTVMLTIIQVTMPRLSNYLGNRRKEDYLNLLNKVIKIYFMLLFPAAIGLLCVSKQAIYLFSGTQYMKAAPVLMIFAVNIVFLLPGASVMGAIVHSNADKVGKKNLYLWALVTIICTIVAFFLMIPVGNMLF